MVKQDLIDSCPVRFFDAAACGGLKSGQMGLVTSKKGLGKTSVLVQFGIDALLHDRHLVHVSFDQHSSNVIAWYDNVLAEICKKKNISDYDELADSIIRDRTILNFNQEAFTLPKVIRTMGALKEGGIKVSAVIIDGLDLCKVPVEDIAEVSDFVAKEGLSVWFSDTNEGASLKDTVSADLEKYFSQVAHIAPKNDGVYLQVFKADGKVAEGIEVKLDAKTMLMTKK